MTFYAYIYRDPSRLDAKGHPEAFYVGKGSNKRCYDHFRRHDKHPFTHRLQKMKRSGVEPIIEVIEAIDERHAFFLEMCLIEVYGRRIDDTGTLHNLSLGGEGSRGFTMSEESKQKLRVANTGRKHTVEHKSQIRDKLKNNKHCVGRIVSQETKDKMSSTNKARWASIKEAKASKEH